MIRCLEDDTSDMYNIATASRILFGEALYPGMPLRSTSPVIETGAYWYPTQSIMHCALIKIPLAGRHFRLRR